VTLGRRVARVRNVVRKPGDVVLFARMVGWAAALPVLKRRMPLPRLVETARPEARTSARPETVIALARWVYRIPGFRDNCLEKSLLTYRYLPAGPNEYRLVLGVRRAEAEGPPGHAWLTIDGRPVHDSPETLVDLVPILAFDEEGRREDVSGPAAHGPGG
jgi:hypothetical protein